LNRLRLAVVGALACAASILALSATQPAGAGRPLATGIAVSRPLFTGDTEAAFARLRRLGITRIAVPLDWPGVAPRRQPTDWNPSDPEDPNYTWVANDERIAKIVAEGFEPIAAVTTAPDWARIHPDHDQSPPRADRFGQFMHAAAERYSGANPDLPQVRYWQIWNEPNISLFLAPQYDPRSGKFTSPDVYRRMVNAAAKGIHRANPVNVVIAGETAPFRDITPGVQKLDKDWGPLKFMRRLLCIDDAGKPTCRRTTSFDVWSTHPYTSGGPTHQATLPYDVSLGDLPEMRKTLNAAIRVGHVRSKRPVRFWVTEFSWDSNPPDRCSPPVSLLKRWVPESMYRMWANGVESISWLQLMDQPMSSGFEQAGLLFHSPSYKKAEAKPFAKGFRFPFVALRRPRGVYVWAHTAFGKPGRVVIQQTFNGGWKKVASITTDRFGVAQKLLHVEPIGKFRAVFGKRSEKSLPFSMRVPPDQFFNPFGQTTLLEPKGKPCSP
jgi:hypothetical protein